MFYTNYICGSISCPFWDIQCRKISQLYIPVKGKSRSLKVLPFDRLCMVFLLLFCSNSIHNFWDIRLQICRDPDNRVRVRPIAAAVMYPPTIFSRRKSSENLLLTPFVAKFFAAENPPKILWHSTTMRGETQPCLIYSRHYSFAISDWCVEHKYWS